MTALAGNKAPPSSLTPHRHDACDHCGQREDRTPQQSDLAPDAKPSGLRHGPDQSSSRGGLTPSTTPLSTWGDECQDDRMAAHRGYWRNSGKQVGEPSRCCRPPIVCAGRTHCGGPPAWRTLMTLFVYHSDMVRTPVLVGWERRANSVESGRAAATKCSNRIELLWPQPTFIGS
jgi:hypothetical protein